MAIVRYLASTKKEGLRFKITGRVVENPEETDPTKVRMRLTLEGAHGITFERLVTPDTLQKYGYTVAIVDE
jgi:hypothetical protein